MIATRFTKMLGSRHPVVQAPMGLISRAELAAAVSNAGGPSTLLHSAFAALLPAPLP